MFQTLKMSNRNWRRPQCHPLKQSWTDNLDHHWANTLMVVMWPTEENQNCMCVFSSWEQALSTRLKSGWGVVLVAFDRKITLHRQRLLSRIRRLVGVTGWDGTSLFNKTSQLLMRWWVWLVLFMLSEASWMPDMIQVVTLWRLKIWLSVKHLPGFLPSPFDVSHIKASAGWDNQTVSVLPDLFHPPQDNTSGQEKCQLDVPAFRPWLHLHTGNWHYALVLCSLLHI